MLHISLKVNIDTEKRQYLTSKVNALFSVKRSFSNEKKDIKKGLPIENDEESYLVDYVNEISNLELLKDLMKIGNNPDLITTKSKSIANF